jgi:hypothetical protein
MSYNPLPSLPLVAACTLALTAAAAGSILINEMELNPPEGGTGWVELYNTWNSSVDISGWTAAITEGGWVGKIMAPEGAMIPPKAFLRPGREHILEPQRRGLRDTLRRVRHQDGQNSHQDR